MSTLLFHHFFKNSYTIAMRSLAIIGLSTLILMQISCQTLGQKTAKSDTTINKNKPAQKISPMEKELPNNELTEEILFKFMLAEVAKQHNDYEMAFYHYMDLSEITADPRIAKSALRVALVLGNNVNIFKAVQLWGELETNNEVAIDKIIDILQIKAVVLYKVKRDQLATKDLLKIMQLSINREQAIARVGIILSSINDYIRLNKVLLILERDYADNYNVNLHFARFALQFKDYKQAEKSINKLLALQPENEQAYLLKAKLYSKTGKQQEALNWYKTSLGQLEKPSLLRLEYIKLLLQLKQRKLAIEQLQYIVDENSDNGNLLYSIGMLAMDIKEYQQAELFFNKLYQLDAHHDQGAFLLGVLAYTQEENEQALQWFEKIKGKKYKYDSLLRKAIILSEKKQYHAAVDVLNSYLDSNVANAETRKKVNLLRLKADILNRAQRYKEAYEAYTNALGIKPHHAELLYGRAMVAEKLDRVDLSEKDLLLIIEKNPNNSNAFNALGFILTEKTTRYSDAKKYIEQALKITPNDMAILDSMGWVLYKLGKIEKSLKFLKQAYDIQQDPEIAAHYGEVLWTSDQKEYAKQIWQSALSKNPEHDVLKSTIATYMKTE
ncbi:MAG: tetratricopeptide repeat protein [Pseudomonadota bacterium]